MATYEITINLTFEELQGYGIIDRLEPVQDNTNITLQRTTEGSFNPFPSGIEPIKLSLNTSIYKNHILTPQNFLLSASAYRSVEIPISLSSLTYGQQKEIAFNEFVETEKFIPDYHVIRFLAEETGEDNITVAKILTAFSNLLTLCKDNNVAEIFALTMRIKLDTQGRFVIINF